MAKRIISFPPVGQRHLAAYLGVSQTYLSMSKSGKHADKNLGPAASEKLAALLKTHYQPIKRTTGTASKKIKEELTATGKRLSQKLLMDTIYTSSRIIVWEQKLNQMIGAYQADKDWFQTLETILASLPPGKNASNDRIWLNNQLVDTSKRLVRNGIPAQVKLRAAIDMDHAKLLIWRNARESLIKELKL